MVFPERNGDKVKTKRGPRGSGKIFFGWWTVLACNIMSIWSSFHGYGFGVFFKPIAEEFNWMRSIVAGAGSLGKLEGGLEGPFGGIVTDRYGPRIICFLGWALACFGLFLMSYVNSLSTFYIFWLIVATGINLGVGGPINKAISQWFVKKRGFATSISKIGFGIGGAVVPIFLTFLLVSYGWRGAFRIMTLLTLTMLPVSWFLIKPHRPEYYGLLPDGMKVKEGTNPTSMLTAGQEYAQEVGEREFTAREAYRTSSFWLMCASISLRQVVTGVVNVHTIPFLTDMGMNPMAAAKGLGLMLGLSIPGRFLGGTLTDKIGIQKIRYLFMFGLGGIAVSFFVLLNVGTNMVLLYAYLILYGVIGLGFCAALHPLIPARYFGRKAYGTIDGTKTFITQIAGIISPVYAGWVYDISGSYTYAFTLIFALSILAIVIMFFAKPPKPTIVPQK